MDVFGSIDVTPRTSFNTFRIQNEALNTIVTSLLTFLILVNLGSIVTKLVNRTVKSEFRYSSWLRAFIFANSNDPNRLVSWVFHRYAFRDPSWSRHEQKLRLERLAFPLLARGVIFVASIISIAISIPIEQVRTDCSDGDYRVLLNSSRAVQPVPAPSTLCEEGELRSNFGEVQWALSFCSCTAEPSFFRSSEDGTSLVVVGYDLPSASVILAVVTRRSLTGFTYYVEWRDGRRDPYRSDITSSISLNDHVDLAVNALKMNEQSCLENGKRIQENDTMYVELTCELDPPRARKQIEGALRGAIYMQKVPTIQERIASGSSFNFTRRRVCPIELNVSEPLLNLLPLILVLAVLFALNVAVGVTIGDSGHALDAAFHLIKEAIGDDCTSNPLEESQGVAVPEVLGLQKCIRGDMGHVGFLSKPGDVFVEDFDHGMIVCNDMGGNPSELRFAEANVADVPDVPGGNVSSEESSDEENDNNNNTSLNSNGAQV